MQYFVIKYGAFVPASNVSVPVKVSNVKLVAEPGADPSSFEQDNWVVVTWTTQL